MALIDFKQPSTILGIAGLIGTTAGTIAHVLTRDMALSVGVATIAGSIVHIIMPDNSGAQSSVEKLVSDAVTAAAQKKLSDALPLLIQDGLAVVNAIAAPAPVPVPVTTTTTTTTQQAPAPVAAPVVAPIVVQPAAAPVAAV